MKVLRLYAIEHYDHRTIWCEAKNCTEHRYSKRQIQRDYRHDMLLADAKQLLYTELGLPPELAEYKYPPQGFVRIMHHTICDDSPELGVVEAERISERDLFSGAEMKAAQSVKPIDPRLK